MLCRLKKCTNIWQLMIQHMVKRMWTVVCDCWTMDINLLAVKANYVCKDLHTREWNTCWPICLFASNILTSPTLRHTISLSSQNRQFTPTSRSDWSVCEVENVSLKLPFLNTPRDYFNHFLCEQRSATPWTLLRRSCLKVCAIIPIYTIDCVSSFYCHGHHSTRGGR